MPSDSPRDRAPLTSPGRSVAADAVPERVPVWALVSALLAPVAMIGGWIVAALPVDAVPRAHGAAAGVAFVALSLWPALGARRRPATGYGALRPLGVVVALRHRGTLTA